MTLDGVAWSIKDAIHDVEVLQALPYVLGGAKEGVAGHTDLRVTATPVNDGNVHVAAGGGNLLNRYEGGIALGYTVRNDADAAVAIDPQGAGGTRFDLVAVVVEDPMFPGQPAPADTETGPFVFFRVYENVGGATTLAEVDPNQTGYALAKITMPASTATVSQAQIQDLRELVNPRVFTVTRQCEYTTAAAFVMPTAQGLFPTDASWDVDIPEWANRVRLEAMWPSVSMLDSSGGGTGAGSGSVVAGLGSIECDAPWAAAGAVAGKALPQCLAVAGEAEIPTGLRGTTQALSAEAVQAVVTSLTARLVQNSSVIVKATFFEVAGAN